MSSLLAEGGETTKDLRKQFKKTTITGGALKGARYLDISHEDLVKAAKAYRSDPRFQQFAKRWVASKLLDNGKDQTIEVVSGPTAPSAPKVWTFCKASASRLIPWLKGRLIIVFMFLLVLGVLLSRPLLYVALGKLFALGIKALLRKTLGLVALVFDSFLEEIVLQLDPNYLGHFLPPPLEAHQHYPTPAPNQMEQPWNQGGLALQLICLIVGALLGQHWPRNAPIRPANPP